MENTEHLKLSLPEGNDYVNIETLNENWIKIDEAIPNLLQLIEGRAQVVSGSYVGTGTYGEDTPNALEFDFVPRVVILISAATDSSGPDYLSLRWLIQPLKGSSWKNPFNTFTGGEVSWSDDGKSVFWWVEPTASNASSGPSAQLNCSGVTYHYIAIG